MSSRENLDALWTELHALRLRNTANEEFIPVRWLSDLLMQDRILEILNEGTIDKDERAEMARVVRNTGLRTFAILVTMRKPDLVYRVFQTDQYRDENDLDKRLPMSDDKLASVLGLTRVQEDIRRFLQDRGGRDAAPSGGPRLEKLRQQETERISLCDDFRSIQYMFLSPTFPQGPLHRLLEDYTRLPFLLPPKQQGASNPGVAGPAQGGFGIVCKETLPPERHGDKACASTSTTLRRTHKQGQETQQANPRRSEG